MVVKTCRQNETDYRKIGTFYADIPEEHISDALIRQIGKASEAKEKARYPLILLKIMELLGGERSIKGEIELSERETALLCMTLSEEYDAKGRLLKKETGFDGLDLDVCLALDMLRAMEQYGLITKKEVINNFDYPNHIESISVRPTVKAIGFVNENQFEGAADVYIEINKCRNKYKKAVWKYET